MYMSCTHSHVHTYTCDVHSYAHCYISCILREGGVITHPNLYCPLNAAPTQLLTPTRTPLQPLVPGQPPPPSPTSPISSSTLVSRYLWRETTPSQSHNNSTTSRTCSPINLHPHSKGFSPRPTYFETAFRPISTSSHHIHILLITRTFTSPSYLMLPPLQRTHVQPCLVALCPRTPLIHPRCLIR